MLQASLLGWAAAVAGVTHAVKVQAHLTHLTLSNSPIWCYSLDQCAAIDFHLGFRLPAWLAEPECQTSNSVSTHSTVSW